MSLKLKYAVPFLFTLLGALALPAFGQAGGGGGGGGNGGGGGGGRGGGGGGFNPQQFQQRMMDNLKTALGATDDEFAALQPKIEKVQTLQRSLQAGGRGGPGGGGRRGGGAGGGGGGAAGGGGAGGGGAAATPATPASPVAAAAADLQTTLADANAKPEDIKTKLDALRAAKKTAKEDLTKAQEDLKSVLTQRQEAVLVEYGMLD